jgi:predicted transcriptional regulator
MESPKDLGFSFSVTTAVEEPRTPTPRELAILKFLWENGPSSVRVVHRGLLRNESVGKELAYNTVQTLLRIMEEKGLVTHHVEGRTFVYTARYSRDESARRFLDRVFDGAASQLMVSLLRTETISEQELDELHELIRQARKARQSREGRR